VQWEKLLVGPIGNLFFDFSTECKTGCEPGETTVATDGWGCRSGTYSYFCCSDPNKPPVPEVPDVKLCYGPSHLDQLESGLEAESNLPNVFEEEHKFDAQCGTTETTRLLRGREQGVDSSNSSMVFLAREATSEELAYMETFELLDPRDLAKRGARERVAMSLCGPKGQKSSIWVQTHPGASSIIRTTGKAWTVAQQGLCAAVGLTGLSTLTPTTDWVTEHVLEKQEFRNALEYMAAGKLPGGAALRAGAVPFDKVFGVGGIFQQNWPTAAYTSLQFTHDWAGNINDFFTGLLGRTADAGLQNRFIENLQVCDRDFNVYKEYMVAGLDFVSRSNWNGYNAKDRVGILLDIVDMHNYRGEKLVVTSFSSTFKNIATLFGDLTRYAATQGVTYDFKDAWEQIMPVYLEWQVNRIRGTFATYISEELLYWASPLAALTHSPTVIAAMTKILTDLSQRKLKLEVKAMTT
jgi:hypothetical protein